MRILITGASGFIGSALTATLLKDGDDVVALSRNPIKCRTRLGDHLRLTVADINNPPIHSIDAVVNLAGAPIADRRWSTQRKQFLLASRAGLTTALLEKLRQHPPPIVVSASAVGFYGNHGDAEVTLNSPPEKDSFEHQLCAAWENSATAAQEMWGARVCIARLGLVLGEGGLIARMAPPFRWGFGAIIGSGAQWMAWVHLSDVIAMLVSMVRDKNRQGTYNLTAPHPVTQRQFAQQLAAAYHRPLWLRVPSFVLRAGLGDLADLLLGGQRVTDGGVQGYTFRYPELSAALKDCTQ